MSERRLAIMRMYSIGALACLGFAVSTISCCYLRNASASEVDRLTTARLIMNSAPQLPDAYGWADDLLSVLKALRIEASRANVCSVIAVIRQESGFAANPTVPGLGEKAEAAALGEIAKSAKLRAYFAVFPDDQREFLHRLRAARTERDLDLAYRWISGVVIGRGPQALTFLIKIINHGMTLTEFFESNNKIRTIGSMQVSVSFALKEGTQHSARDLKLEDTYRVRDFLYTRKGGLYYGILQLLGYSAGYANKAFLFADYNAGRYSSRNAAVQFVVSALTGKRLELDGDLLSYSGQAPLDTQSATETAINHLLVNVGALHEKQVRADLLLEKSPGFSVTPTFRLIQMLYQRKMHRPAPAAIIPRIELHSVKITRHMTTADFARSVEKHYHACKRAPLGSVKVAQQRPE